MFQARFRPMFIAVALALSLGGSPLLAQCSSSWLFGETRSTPTGNGSASVVWDPDGAGPAPTVLVVGGTLGLGATPNAGVFTYDGSVWTQLGTLGGAVRALAVWNGVLHAAVNTVVAGVTTSTIQAWLGSTWQTIGTAQGGSVECLAVYNNELIAGGAFGGFTGVFCPCIARWNGTSWTPLGSTFGFPAEVRAMAVYNGSLVVGGYITIVGGSSAGHLVFWNGSNWSVGPFFDSPVNALTVRSTISLATTYLFVGGLFSGYTIAAQYFGAQRVVRYDSNNVWTAVGAGLPSSCNALGVRNIGINGYELFAGVQDLVGSQSCWRYSGGTWTALAGIGSPPIPVVNTLAFYGGRWTAGINMGITSGRPAVYSWDGAVWSEVAGQGIQGVVDAVEPRGNGVVIGGTFTKAAGLIVNGIAQGGPTTWVPLGGGVTGGVGVHALATAANGDLIAGGEFTAAGGVSCSNVARWDGSAWSPLGSGVVGAVRALLALPNGDVIAAGDLPLLLGNIVRWNGSSWLPFGLGCNGIVHALARLPNGDIVAGGDFTSAGLIPVNRIARWNGSTWSALGAGCNDSVYALAVAPNGDLHAGGKFTSVGAVPCRLARWNGSWSATFAPGVGADVLTLALHPSGNLFVGGGVFSYQTPLGGYTSNLVRIQPSGTLLSMEVQGTVVRDIAFPAGDVAIGGALLTAGGLISVNYARYDTTCPATATTYGVGCTTATGAMSLNALEAPWIGGAYRLRASTFAPTAFAVRAIGFGTLSLPLSAVLPGSLPGCMGLVTPDAVDLGMPSGGELVFGGVVPSTPSLVGLVLNAQVLQFDVQGSGFVISSTNAVGMVVGVL